MSTESSHLDLLTGIPLFAGCSKNELRQIAQLTSELQVPKGKVLTREGDPGEECFVIVSGRVGVDIGGARVTEMGPGEIVGEMSLLDMGPRTATVTAEEDLDVLILNPREFASLLQNAPNVAYTILKTLAGRIRTTQTRGSA